MAGKPPSLGRSQKYHARVRHLYALRFNNGCCYIGQSVDLKKREQQHRSRAGGWTRPFELIPLGCIKGTQADAEVHEYAWRLKAHQFGWRVYATPPGILIRNPERRCGGYHYSLANSYHWPAAMQQYPKAQGKSFVSRLVVWSLVVLVLAMAFEWLKPLLSHLVFSS